MARNRMSVEFTGFKEMFEKLDKLGGDTKKITEKALQKSYDHVTPQIKQVYAPHNIDYTGDTGRALADKEKVTWSGYTGTIKVGFNIAKGGLPSIFLMYGTPTMRPDKKLYNSIYGSKTKKEVKKIQEEIFREELGKVMG